MAIYTVFFSSTTSKLQATTYLIGICLFSITFLVFLNSTVSFVVTDLIHAPLENVGDYVGTLSFADELLALFMCPVWGVLSDRLGVRWVASTGFALIGISLFVFVQAKDVYPQLLLARLIFSLGGAACTTMITATLPAVAGGREKEGQEESVVSTASITPSESYVSSRNGSTNGHPHKTAASVSSELTITQERFSRPERPSSNPRALASRDGQTSEPPDTRAPSRLAGVVGMCTGLGALLALGVFLPLRNKFESDRVSGEDALKDSYYVVGSIALVVAIFTFIGLRGLPSEAHKGISTLLASTRLATGRPHQQSPYLYSHHSYYVTVRTAFLASTKSRSILLAYVGSLVARTSSVAISLFIPLTMNTYYRHSGRCVADPDPRSSCPEAFSRASMLTGISQLTALLLAPVFGALKANQSRYHVPLLITTFLGLVGYVGFATLPSPEPREHPQVILYMMMIGAAQIGAIVGSLGMIGRGVLEDGSRHYSTVVRSSSTLRQNGRSERDRHQSAGSRRHSSYDAHQITLSNNDDEQEGYTDSDDEPPYASGQHRASTADSDRSSDAHESTPFIFRRHHHRLAPQTSPPVAALALSGRNDSLYPLRGSIAGIYSFVGGLGILFLTKAGGYLFAAVSEASPYYIMAVFCLGLMLAIVGVGLREGVLERREGTGGEEREGG